MTTTRRPRSARLLAITALLAATTTTLVAGASPATAADSSNQLKVTAGEYTYKLSGAPKPGWVEIEFDNAGVEYHMLAVAKLKPGVTAKQLKKAAATGNDAAFEKLSAKNVDVSGMPQLLGPGESTTVISEMGAGHYGMLCFLPDPEGKPHMLHGMIKTFDVKGSKSSFQPPTDGVGDVTLSDTAVTIPSTGITKNATLKITNEGEAPHSFTIVELEPGKTIPDLDAYFNVFFESGQGAGAAPGVVIAGVSTMSPGSMSYLLLDLEPGHYGYASTEGEAPDNDIAKGMYGEFDVA